MQCGRIIRKFSTFPAMSAIKNVTVVGGGAMGSGIAQVSAAAGNTVNLVDLSEDVLKKSKASIQQGLTRVGKKLYDILLVNGKDEWAVFSTDPTHLRNGGQKYEEPILSLSTQSSQELKDDGQLSDTNVKDQQKIQDFVANTIKNINFTSDLPSAVKSTDLVVEAIVENLEAKKKLFQSIDNVAPANTIFATNTSSIKVGKICENLSRKDRFGGLHFFNPVQVMKLVEVVSTNETSKATHQALAEWGKSVGKVTVDCKDTPGFIVNQLLVPYLVEAINMVDREDASPRDIDTAMKLGAGYPMGPLELADYVGLDVIYFILTGWSQEFPDEKKYKVPASLKKLVDQKRFGVKTGAGFYDYPSKK